MQAARIQGWAVVKVTAIALVVIAAAVLLSLIVLEIRTTLKWAFAGVFLALALAPAVALVERVRIRGARCALAGDPVIYVLFAALFVFLMLEVISPIIKGGRGPGAEAARLRPRPPANGPTTTGI